MKLYYHVYLTDNPSIWSGIVIEQLRCMDESTLLKSLDNIEFVVITQNDGRVSAFKKLCETFETSAKINYTFIQNPYKSDIEMLTNIESDATITENVTMQKIYNDAQNEDTNLLYVHTKGITSLIKHFNRGNVHDYMKYYYWRQYLNWGVLTKWIRCYNQTLYLNDVAGINYRDNPSPHFSGNFWWSKSSYIKTLPDPSTLDWWNKLQRNTTDSWLKVASHRFRDEMWVCSNTKKIYNIHSMEENPASELITTRRYLNDELN